MKASILTAAVAVAVLGFAGTASAQVGYNYRTYNPYTSSFINGQMVYTPFGAQNTRVFNNPYYGYSGRAATYQDPFGNTYGQVTKYNPFTGLGYTSGYYNPGLYGNPYLGYRYGYYFR
jgi:hypothetical protein